MGDITGRGNPHKLKVDADVLVRQPVSFIATSLMGAGRVSAYSIQGFASFLSEIHSLSSLSS